MNNKITYAKVGDYNIPNLLHTTNINTYVLRKHGKIRIRYLKKYKYAEYIILLSENKLREHLKEVDITSYNQINLLIRQFAERENITEELKLKIN